MPRVLDDGWRCVALPQRAAEKRVIPAPGRFDKDAPQMGIAGFGDGAPLPEPDIIVMGRADEG